MRDYEISKETLAVIPIGEKKSKVVEKDCSFIVNNLSSVLPLVQNAVF